MRSLAVVTAVVLLGACSSVPKSVQRLWPFGDEPVVLPASAVAQTANYRIGPEDVLEITVWKEDALKKEVVVRPDGGISYPLAGDLQAAGKTADELKQEITQRIEKFIPEPVVNVALLKVASYRIYVIGRVAKPGEFPSGRNVDVLQALSMAGGLTPFAAADRIRVIRKVDGKSYAIPFVYSEVKSGAAMEQNIVLKSGDVVLVP